jgi:hypothetical protein
MDLLCSHTALSLWALYFTWHACGHLAALDTSRQFLGIHIWTIFLLVSSGVVQWKVIQLQRISVRPYCITCIYVDYTCSHHIWKFYLEEGLLIIECVLLKGSQWINWEDLRSKSEWNLVTVFLEPFMSLRWFSLYLSVWWNSDRKYPRHFGLLQLIQKLQRCVSFIWFNQC